MEQWKKNLAVLWIGQFLVMGGMTMIMPFMSLYLQSPQIGMSNQHEIATWAGIIFAGNFVTSFLFQPLWGKLSDKYGRKMMLLRSGFGMAIVMVLMGFATSPWHLLLLRMVNGTISGFNPAAVSLISITTPKPKMGFAMGTLQSGGIAGSIMGPFLGGLLADAVGYRPIFYLTGASLFAASLLAYFVVKERFDRSAAAAKPHVSVIAGFRQLSSVPQLTALFAVTFLLQFAMIGPNPLMPLYVQKLHGTSVNLAFWAGFVSSAAGITNMFAAPLLGRLSDRIGQERVLGISLVGAAVMFIPQAFAGTVWQLLLFRLLQGCFLGGLIPSVNALVRRFTPDGMEGRAFSLNSSMLALGNMIGPIVGGFISGWTGIGGVFLISAALFVVNALWVRQTLVSKRVREPLKE
ncbi:multidrug efflux MFS transporter [Paenibacillus rhizovicinus]|uniref:Multidrug efflux MFS transporter n=1 Tax=Paenibacillus rhizovicinus TaxID=2704463 RepID=A0A6C0P928_9BACL|nr:MFS transporter [Paenibacillus rhizovicinus]QHW34123.1 multidrug efflux MFS transporter [Paenibacillus rhizovicinus]